MKENNHKQWSLAEENRLKELGGKTPTRVIGLKLGRTEDAIRAKAQDLGISLKPVNQSPYGTAKKK